MTPAEIEFGRFLASVAERDIDILLMEEFHCEPSFVQWFCKQLKTSGDVKFVGAWHSVCDADGETDLLLKIAHDNKTIGIFIENKIAAAEQPQQDERYHVRAVRLQQQGKFDSFVTCMCAPQVYLDALDAASLYQCRISYEQISQWFSSQPSARHKWRSQILFEAVEQGRRGYKMIVNRTVTEFHRAYWQYLRQNHPRIVMAKPTPKGSKSNWIILKGKDFPAKVRLHHKIDQRVLELGFQGHEVEDLAATKTVWPNEITLVQKGGVAAISVDVPEIDMTKSIAAQKEDLESVFSAAYRLFPYANLLVSNTRT